MRCFFLITALSLTSLTAWAEPVSVPAGAAPEAAAQFQLGGSATRNAPMFRDELSFPERGLQDQSLLAPVPPSMAKEARPAAAPDAQNAPFFLEGIAPPGDEIFSTSAVNPIQSPEKLYTAPRNPLLAGPDITLLNTETFLDIMLSEGISLGLSSIRDTAKPDAAPARQLGLSAEFTTPGGAYLKGGVADAEALEPVFGLSLGLRF